MPRPALVDPVERCIARLPLSCPPRSPTQSPNPPPRPRPTALFLLHRRWRCRAGAALARPPCSAQCRSCVSRTCWAWQACPGFPTALGRVARLSPAMRFCLRPLFRFFPLCTYPPVKALLRNCAALGSCASSRPTTPHSLHTHPPTCTRTLHIVLACPATTDPHTPPPPPPTTSTQCLLPM